MIDLYFINKKRFKVLGIFKVLSIFIDVHSFYFRKCFSNDDKKGIVHCNIEKRDFSKHRKKHKVIVVNKENLCRGMLDWKRQP